MGDGAHETIELNNNKEKKPSSLPLLLLLLLLFRLSGSSLSRAGEPGASDVARVSGRRSDAVRSPGRCSSQTSSLLPDLKKEKEETKLVFSVVKVK